MEEGELSYRKDLFLDNQYVETIKELCKGFEERHHMKFETIGFDEDHLQDLMKIIYTLCCNQFQNIRYHNYSD